MGNIVTNQEVVDFLRIKGMGGDIVQVGADTDPNTATMNAIVQGVEGMFNARTGHSWGALAQSQDEIHNFNEWYEYGRGMPIHLAHRSVVAIDSNEGDKVEIWDGIRWTDRTSNENSYSMLLSIGKIYVVGWYYTIYRDQRLRVTYRYGTLDIPPDIKLAVLQKCGVKLLETSFGMSNIEYGGDRGVQMTTVIEKWNEEFDDCIQRWQDFQRVDW